MLLSGPLQEFTTMRHATYRRLSQSWLRLCISTPTTPSSVPTTVWGTWRRLWKWHAPGDTCGLWSSRSSLWALKNCKINSMGCQFWGTKLCLRLSFFLAKIHRMNFAVEQEIWRTDMPFRGKKEIVTCEEIFLVKDIIPAALLFSSVVICCPC